MGGQVSLLCIRWDLQCLDFGLSPSKHCRKVKAVFKAAAQLHTSVAQTDDFWPLIRSVELRYGIWAACVVDVFYHFWMFGGFASENTPFFHPFCTHLFSLLLWQSGHLCDAPFPAEQKQPVVLPVEEKWHRGVQTTAPVSPLTVSTAHPPFSRLLLLCTKAASDPFGSDMMNLKTSYGVSSGLLLPQHPQHITLLHSPRLSVQGVAITI